MYHSSYTDFFSIYANAYAQSLESMSTFWPSYGTADISSIVMVG